MLFRSKPGDRVVIALSGNSFLKACLVAFGIPLAAVLTSLLIAHLNGVSSDTQVWVAVAAFIAGLAPVRIIGRNFATPKIIEVLHEQG